jgi:hypothetical protein
METLVELRSTGRVRAPAPTWFAVRPMSPEIHGSFASLRMTKLRKGSPALSVLARGRDARQRGVPEAPSLPKHEAPSGAKTRPLVA